MFASKEDAKAVWDVLQRNHPNITAKVETAPAEPKGDAVSAFVEALKDMRKQRDDEALEALGDILKGKRRQS